MTAADSGTRQIRKARYKMVKGIARSCGARDRASSRKARVVGAIGSMVLGLAGVYALATICVVVPSSVAGVLVGAFTQQHAAVIFSPPQ